MKKNNQRPLSPIRAWHSMEKKIAKTIYGIETEIAGMVKTVKERDPAARSSAEILLLYSGVHAVMAHRISHKLYEKGLYFSARTVSQGAKLLTGIEIHPAAKIGKDFFIDHGTGVVIGETAEIGDHCTLYQGVTLGGTGKDTGKRHPTLGNNVLVGAGAKVLGPINISDNSKVAANAVVLKDISENSTAVGIPARVVRQAGRKVDDLDQVHIPDPVAQESAKLEERFDALTKELDALKAEAESGKKKRRK